MTKEVEALSVLISARTAEFEKLMNAAERRVDKVERKMRGSTALIERDAQRMAQRVGQSFDQVGKSFNLSGLALGGIGLGALTKEALDYSDAWTRAKNSLAVAGLEGKAQTDVMDALFASAQKNSIAIGSLTELYGKASQNSKALGADQNSLIKFTDGIAVALKAAGTSSEAASGALLQLSQLLGSGTVHAQEFNSVNEGAPTILKAVAAGLDGAGGSIASLRAKVLAGQLTSKQFFDAFLKGKPVIDDMAARALPTVENAITRVNNSLTKYVGENAGAQGATHALISGLNALADNFNTTADVALQFAGIIAAALTGRAIGGMIASLLKGGGAIAAFVRTLATLRTAGGIGSLATAFGGLGAAAGPVGAVLGIAAAAGLYFYETSKQASEGADEAAASLQNLGLTGQSTADQIRKAAAALRDLTAAQLEQKKAQTQSLIQQKIGELNRVPLTAVGINGRATTPQGRVLAPQLYQLSKQLDENKISQKDFNKALDDLVAKNPKLRDIAVQWQEIAKQIYAARDGLKAIADASGPTSVATGHAFDVGTNQGLNATLGPGAVTNAGAGDLADASKTDHQKSVDKQTSDLAKAYAATGQKITDGVAAVLREIATKIVDAQDAAKRTQEEYKNSVGGSAEELIKGFEKFSGTAYDDKTVKDGKAVSSGYAIGYGTHTVGGKKVQPGDTISVDQADAELKDRIAKIQSSLSDQLGSTFTNLGKEQQAALDSIVYNYGRLPADILKSLQTGTTADVAAAIRSHASDNGGINRERRNKEASLYEGGATDQQKTQDDLTKRSTDTKRVVQDMDLETDARKRRADAIAAGTKEEDYFDAQLLRSQYILDEMRKDEDAEVPRSEARTKQIEDGADRYVAAKQREFDAEKRNRDIDKNRDQVRDAEKFFADSSFDALDGLINKTETASQALKKLAQSFIEAALKATLLGEGPLAGIFGSAQSGGIFGSIAKAFTGVSTGTGKASGGRVSKGQLYPVGEHGREMFAPGENGRIIPAMPNLAAVPQARGASSAISPTLKMTFNLAGANGDATIERISRQAATQAAQESYRLAVRDSQRASVKTQYNRDVLGQAY